MKRKMYFKTKWGVGHSPFTCALSGKLHFPEVEVWVETPAGSKESPYKDIDKLMYESGSSKGTFEVLAERITKGLVEKIQEQGKEVPTKVTVRVAEDPDFWVEAAEEKETLR